MVGKGAYAALAQNYLIIALAHHVLGRHQKLFQGSREAALDEHRLPQLSGALQQGKVLHVARADLHHIGPFSHQVQSLVVDGLGDYAQPEALADLGHDAQRLHAQALKRVR